jgi:hypothetical protein
VNRDNNSKENRVKTTRRKRPVVQALLLLLLLLFIIFLLRDRLKKTTTSFVADSSLVVKEDTASRMNGDTIITLDSSITGDSVVAITRPSQVKKVAVPQVPKVDSAPAAMTTFTDTSAVNDTARDTMMALPEGRCAEDTAELWVYPDPSGGLHYTSVRISFIANRAATVHYRTGDDTVWHRYTGDAIIVETSTTLYYDAIDSCGNVMERRSEYYEVEKKNVASPCHPGMEQVKVGTMNFCIDRYEWPNRKGKKPQAYISFYQATDSCFSVGKRLCTSEEWSIACSGPYSWKYPYGQRYERYGCSTHDSVVVASGSKPECRSFYGLYDMSGNLLEWTTTKSVENRAFYYVMGGFWESGPKSGCFDKRYSYYPQNQHNPVGFRCCRTVESAPTQPAEIGK